MKKRDNIVIIVILVVLVISIVGVSYAAFNYTKEGSGVNKITTGDLSMEYTETDNVISINNALLTTDSTGMVRLTEGEYFDFTITSSISNNTNINYEISAKEEGTGTIDGSNMKLYLTEMIDGEERSIMNPKVYSEESTSNDYTGRPSNEMSLYQSSMNSSEEHHYRLRMYVTEEYNPQGDGGGLTFAVRVNVYGMAGAWEYVMANYNNTIANSGFSTMPESKYYDLYTSNSVSTACNGSVCLSHGLSETAGWYGDGQTMVSEESPLLVRGGGPAALASSAGVFNFGNGSGDANSYNSFCLVLSPSI